MTRFYKKPRKNLSTVTIGWLFADLLLALAMIFLLANTVGSPLKPKPKPMPVVHSTPTATPTPAAKAQLEQNWYTIPLQVDSTGILNNDKNAINNFIHQIETYPALQKRSIGLVIVYAGAPDLGQTDRAINLAKKIYNILKKLGDTDSRFKNLATYDPLHILGKSPDDVTLDIFLFAQA